MEKLVIPKFGSEAEEAEWWYQNREALAEEFALADKKDNLHFGSTGILMIKSEITVPVSAEDAAAIRKLAARTGQPEAAYAGTILHEALQQKFKDLPD